MIILPAVDIKDGQPVRLRKGDFNTASVVADGVVSAAEGFKKDGASWLHMVDLDGAVSAKPMNGELIIETAKKTGLKVEVGGGIRSFETAEYYLKNGVQRVIFGSAALKNPEIVEKAVKLHGDKIAVGIDAKNGRVATEGWLETGDDDYIEIAKKMESIGVKYIIFTDISKDGMLSGPNFNQLEAINNAVSCHIIASGGITSISDLEKLDTLGMYGAICGKSIYSGTIKLKEALRLEK